MNKILTVPKELEENKEVLYAGNHFISLPEINIDDAAIKSLNIISLRNKGLAEVSGDEYLFRPVFYKNGKKLATKKIIHSKEHYYVPVFNIEMEDNTLIKIKIYADLKEKGFVYSFETSQPVEIELKISIEQLKFLRFNSHNVKFEKELQIDKWLNNPCINLNANNISFALAFGADSNFAYDLTKNQELTLKTVCENKNGFYFSFNSDSDGASTTLIHLKRKGYQVIYQELIDWLNRKIIKIPADNQLEDILNQNIFYNYFFAIGKDMESDKYVAMTSRSPRYYVSGAFWERDSFLWSFPAIRIIDHDLHTKLVKEMILRHYINAGDHAHYIDGTVLYPGFELDQAASYFILLNDFEKVDNQVISALEEVLKRIEEEYDDKTGLYKTFLLPSDDPSEYPFVTIDNVILWQGFNLLKELYLKSNKLKEAEFLNQRIKSIVKGINKYLVKKINDKEMFVWSADGNGNYRLYNDPPGNLSLMQFYGFVDENNPVFQNTVNYYYSPDYSYYFKDAEIKELACDHHPYTPSGLGLCASILNPLRRKKAIVWLKNAEMDYGLLAESFDKNTGKAKTGVGFATGSGYLAFALYNALVKGD